MSIEDNSCGGWSEIDGLIGTFSFFIEKKADRDKARSNCDGTWGYFGQRYEDELDQAKSDLKKALDYYVDSRIVKHSCADRV